LYRISTPLLLCAETRGQRWRLQMQKMRLR
jgi:hypothetical protein